MDSLSSLEIQAMLIRLEAALGLRKERELDGLDALIMVIVPTKATLEASMMVAMEKGISCLAEKLAEHPVNRKPYGSRLLRERKAAVAAA